MSVCVQDGTTTRANLADFFKANSMTYSEVIVAGPSEAIAKLESGGCDAYTTDQSALYIVRLGMKKPSEATILPDVISKEPLGPAVRADDVAWFNVVKWTLYALINAEELGVGKATLDEALQSQKPAVRRLLGVEGDFGREPRADQGLGAARHSRGRQLRRHVRDQSRRPLALRDPARPQPVVGGRRHPLRAAAAVGPLFRLAATNRAASRSVSPVAPSPSASTAAIASATSASRRARAP